MPAKRRCMKLNHCTANLLIAEATSGLLLMSWIPKRLLALLWRLSRALLLPLDRRMSSTSSPSAPTCDIHCQLGLQHASCTLRAASSAQFS